MAKHMGAKLALKSLSQTCGCHGISNCNRCSS